MADTKQTQDSTTTYESLQDGLASLKKDTLNMLIALGKELNELEAKKQEFVQLFQSYDALATPKEKQVYQQMMANK